MAYQYCKICALSEWHTKARVHCSHWNRYKKHHNWCKEFAPRKKTCSTIKKEVIMDYEKKYKEAVEKAKKELQICGSTDCDAAKQIFRFFPELKEHNAVAFIDLGLPSGTLWADRNLGADYPEQKGNYYRFGETVPYTEDSPEYVYDEAGTNKDAVTVLLGEGCHTPTFKQIEELLDNCEQKWTAINNINGIKVTGPNGNSIFFPAAGYRNISSGSLSNVGSYGYYWSASPNNTNNGRYLNFYSSYWDRFNCYRACGLPIRPVKLKGK